MEVAASAEIGEYGKEQGYGKSCWEDGGCCGCIEDVPMSNMLEDLQGTDDQVKGTRKASAIIGKESRTLPLLSSLA